MYSARSTKKKMIQNISIQNTCADIHRCEEPKADEMLQLPVQQDASRVASSPFKVAQQVPSPERSHIEDC